MPGKVTAAAYKASCPTLGLVKSTRQGSNVTTNCLPTTQACWAAVLPQCIWSSCRVNSCMQWECQTNKLTTNKHNNNGPNGPTNTNNNNNNKSLPEGNVKFSRPLPLPLPGTQAQCWAGTSLILSHWAPRAQLTKGRGRGRENQRRKRRKRRNEGK